MKLFKIIFIILFTVKVSAIVVNYSDLPEDIQRTVMPDMEGKVLLNDLDIQLIENASFERELPQVAVGWPVSYTGSNCKNGAIYVNMDADPELEILFGVGTKITALNIDGTAVNGWPVQLSFYIWSSPAAGDIDGDGEMEIVCTSRNNTTANSGDLYAFELDGTVCTGFPVTQAGGGTNNACLYDLDTDGDMEILVNVRNHPQGWVYVYNGDGSVYEGFPQELDYIPGAGISVGDITGDGIPEIVALSYNMLHVFDLQGNILPGFPVENTGYTYSYSQPIIYDLDNDGLREIIWGGCSGSAGAVFAVNQDASSVDGWPQTTNYWIFGTVSLGDVDQDGSLDVVIGDQVGSGTPVDQIFAWDSSGNAITGFPAGPTNAIYSQIGIADLDGDGDVELMIDDNNFGFGYNAYNHDGTQCVDWPLACGTGMYSTTMEITPVFGDVDNDNQLEIIGAATDIMNWVVECYLWETDTVWNEDLAYMIIDGVNIQHNGLYDPDTVVSPPTNCEAVISDYNDILVSWELEDPTVTGFNIYENELLVEENIGAELREFLFEDKNEGIYEYYLTALYDEEESLGSNNATVEVVLDPPINVLAESQPPNIVVTWEAPVRGIDSYNVYRDGEIISVGETGFVFIDIAVPTGTYLYNVSTVYDGGWESELSEELPVYHVDGDDILFNKTELIGNYPNPFNPTTMISFSVTQNSDFVNLEIFNIKGQKVKQLVSSQLSAGQHFVVWNGNDENGKSVSSGIYFYKMKSGKFTSTKKMILLK